MEFVYVVNRTDLFDLAYPHGFVGGSPPEGHHSLDTYLERIRTHGYFVEREYAERNSALKQIIPYTLVVHDERIFMVRRLPTGGEKRLFGKRSIGMGGHMNPEDDAGGRDELVARCARRELAEELIIESAFDIRPAGVINDDANPVGSVHFGLVQVAQLKEPRIAVRETETLVGSFVPIAEAKAMLDDPEANLETWSSLILEQIDRVLTESV